MMFTKRSAHTAYIIDAAVEKKSGAEKDEENATNTKIRLAATTELREEDHQEAAAAER
jgi:hypothetical protein